MAETKYTFLELGKINAPYMDELGKAQERVLRSGRYIGGKEVADFEQNLCALTGARYAVAVSNGLDALRLVLRAWVEMGELQKGDGVIVPANTYIASVLAITDAGLTPVVAEPSETDLNLDVDKIEALITPSTRAIMPVHLYGRVCWNDKLQAIVEKYGLKVLEDNAQAIGASLGGRMTGNFGDAAAFSFYPTKNIGALGDAGAVTTSDRKLADTVRALANYGGDRRYHNIYCGFNCRMDPVQAAFLNVKLPHVNEENAYRRRIAAIYRSEITNPKISIPAEAPEENAHVYHQFIIICDDRDRLGEYLTENGVGWDIHYETPVHRQPCYADTLGKISHPVAEKLGRSILSLPITRCTSESDAHEIAAIINRF